MLNKSQSKALVVSVLALTTLSANAAGTITYYEQQLQSQVFTAVFYSSSIVLLLVFALFNVASRNNFGLWYTLQFAIGLFFVACIDGTANKVLWPTRPELNNWIPLTALLTLNGNGLMLALASSGGESNPLMKKFSGVFHVMGLINFLCIALIPIVPIIVLALIANILFPPMIVAQVLSAMSWRTAQVRGADREFGYAGRFSRITGLLFLISAVVVAAVAWYQMSKGTFSYAELSFVAVRLVYTLLSLSLVGTYLAHIIGMRLDREEALQRELQSARRAVQAGDEKLQAEREFARMRDVAAQRRQKLSEASHDIRQPLVSLRLTLDKLKQSADISGNIEYQQALEYIDQLAQSFSTAEREAAPEAVAQGSTQTEVMPMNLLMQTMAQMFQQEAAQRNIELRTVPTQMSALVNPVAVMRITSNLVSNAIEHSGTKKIVLGCRRQGTSLTIEVHDQGDGLSQQQFETLQQRGIKGAGSAGQGLGLANCAELAQAHAYRFSVGPSFQSGNGFRLQVPRHA